MVALLSHGVAVRRKTARASPGLTHAPEGYARSQREITARVPSVKTLTQQYGVAQGTAERALAVLREEGLIRGRMGRGHFVVPRG